MVRPSISSPTGLAREDACMSVSFRDRADPARMFPHAPPDAGARPCRRRNRPGEPASSARSHIVAALCLACACVVAAQSPALDPSKEMQRPRSRTATYPASQQQALDTVRSGRAQITQTEGRETGVLIQSRGQPAPARVWIRSWAACCSRWRSSDWDLLHDSRSAPGLSKPRASHRALSAGDRYAPLVLAIVWSRSPSPR